MTDRAIMQQALEALELLSRLPTDNALDYADNAIDALRTRLAQPERVQLTVRDFVVTVGGIEDAVGTPTYWAEWPNKEGY